MNKEHLVRRLVQYALGLFVMALGVVLMKRADLGISPITCVPAAISNVTPITLGNLTIMLHAVCTIIQCILMRRVSLYNVLTMAVGFPFGYIIDGLMLVIKLEGAPMWLRCLALLAALACSGMGIHLMVGSDLMMPAPDGLSHTISQTFHKKLSNVKVCSDAVYVATSVVLDLIFMGRIVTAGLGTVASVLLVGRFVGLFGKVFPQAKMAPFWPVKKA